MVEGNTIGAAAARPLASLTEALRSPAIWLAGSRYALLVIATLVTFSVLAAAIPTFLGMDSFIVDGGSMRPAVPAGALVVSRRVDPASVQAGEIVTFRHSTSPGTPVTQRVVKVLRERDGSVNLLTKGDANATADPEPVASDLPVSRLVYSLPYAGYILEFSRTSAGKVALIAVPALLLLLSISRRSTQEAATAAAATKATATMVTMINPTVVAPLPADVSADASASALARLAQRPPPAATSPGLLGRLLAAFHAPPQAPAPIALDVHAAHAAPNAPAATPTRPALPVSAPRVIAALPARESVAAVEELLDGEGVPPLLHLARLRLRSVSRLADITRSFDRVESEAGPLLDLVADLETVHRRFADNLDAAMRPLTEFADRWDENLVVLAERMESDVPIPEIDIAAERRRISEIRAQFPHRHSLLVGQFAVEKQAVDAALTVFDDQVARLESQLTAARRTAEAIGDSMRSADFGRTVAFLRRRMEQLASLAERGAATPQEIAEAMPAALALAADDEEMRVNSPYLQSVLAILDEGEPAADLPRTGWGAA